MTIFIALIFAMSFQFVAAIISISLIRSTRYNFSWVILSVAFLLMAFRRMVELADVWRSGLWIPESPVSTWMSVAISVFILIGVIYIKRIFNLQKRIDDLKRENESRVLSAIIKTEEKERLKFSKELHDGLGPLLSSIKMSLSALEAGTREPGDRKILDNTGKLIDESVSTIKEISNKLSPHILNNFGLLRAVRSFIDRIETPADLQIRVNSNIEETRFDYNIEVVLYRIICELINNTVKHADATEINVDLYYDENRLTLDYFDNGKGFDTEKVLNLQPGMGYSNIQSRIKSINGKLDVISNVDEGVCVKIAIKTVHHE
ncbi:MAG TPA: sensor histidine kinase [Bacteroides sp.]|mgnify:CR=1 FL=1|nr:sensor histidine kinase [Bacteroides sp.]